MNFFEKLLLFKKGIKTDITARKVDKLTALDAAYREKKSDPEYQVLAIESPWGIEHVKLVNLFQPDKKCVEDCWI